MILLNGAIGTFTIYGRRALAAEAEYKPAEIRLDLAPDQSK